MKNLLKLLIVACRLAVMGSSLLSGASALAEEKSASPKITYDEHVQPILREKCFSCHNPDKRSGDLDMTNFTNIMQGGGSGEVIEPGDASLSYLYMLVTHESEPLMPPESPKLPEPMLNTIAQWIDGGALENSGSTAPKVKKPKFEMAVAGAPTDRPAEVPLPARISLESTCRTESITAVSAVAASPWAPLVAVASSKQVLLYHSQTMQLVAVLPFPEGDTNVLKFSRNGSLLLAGGGRGAATGRVVVWNVKTGQRVFEIGDELDAVLAADISADQTQIALGGPQRVVRVYSTETGELIREMRKHTDWIRSISFSPDNVLLATADRNGGLLVWEAYTGREYGVLKGHRGAVTGLSWRVDSNILASAAEDGTIRLWEMEQIRQVKSFKAHDGGVSGVEFTRDGRLVSCGRDRLAKLWDQNGKQLRAFEPFSDLALVVTYCNETNCVVAGDWTGAVRVFAEKDGALAGTLNTNPPHLADRLTAVTSLLSNKRATQKALTDTAQASRTQADQAQARLTAAATMVHATQKQFDTATTAIQEFQQKLAQSAATREAAEKATLGLEKAIPLLTEATEKAEQTAQKLANDSEFVQAATALRAIVERRVVELESQRNTVQKSTQAAGQFQQQLTATQTQLADSTQKLQQLRQQVEKLSPLAKETEEKALKAKGAEDTASQEIAAVQQQVNRWNNEIAFTRQMGELIEKRKMARTELAVRQSEYDQLVATAAAVQADADKLHANLAVAEAAMATTKKQLETANGVLVESTRLQVEATSTHQTAVEKATSLETLFHLVQAASIKTDEAVAKSSGSNGLAEAAAKLKTELENLSKNLEGAHRQTKDLVGKLEQSKSQVAAAEKQVAAATVSLQGAQQNAQKITPTVAAADIKTAAAKQAVDQGVPMVSAAHAALDRVNDEIAAAQGINLPKPDQEANSTRLLETLSALNQ
jgi:hypothetical protein